MKLTNMNMVQVRTRGASRGMRVLAAVCIAVAAFLLLRGYLAARANNEMVMTIQPTPAAPVVTPDPNSAQGTRVTDSVYYPALTLYAIQLGAYDTEDAARIEASRYVGRGSAGYVMHDTRYRVLGALYEKREQAVEVRDQLSAQKVESYVYSFGADAVELRVTAQRAQIDALQAGMQAFRNEAAALSAVSFAMDRGESTVAEALDAIAAQSERLDQANRALSAVAGRKPNPVAAGLIVQLQSLSQRMIQLTADDAVAPMALSSKIKHAYIESMEDCAAYQRTITGQPDPKSEV